MWFKTPEIAWNGTDPVLSIDFGPGNRLATAGVDKTVNIYRIESDGSITFLSQLIKHTRAVNVVRFSPNGKFLASTSDDGIIYVWKLSEAPARRIQGMTDSVAPLIVNQEDWVVHTTLSKGGSDIYALDWSADSTQLVVGAFDGAVYIWYPEKEKGARFHEIKDHRTLVQGVAMDPLNSMIVTQAADKSVRVYKKSKKGRRLFCAHHIRTRETDLELDKKELAASEAHRGDDEDEDTENARRFFRHHYFLDDSAPTFFRRAAWSPEGNFLFLPCGQIFDSPSQLEPQNVTWVFTREGLGHAAACCIPSSDMTIAVRFSPILYKSGHSSTAQVPSSSDNISMEVVESTSTQSKSEGDVTSEKSAAKEEKNFKLFDISYKLVFAIATWSSVYIYDTEHEHPIAALQDPHHAKLTDLSWSEDGRKLAISSTDGYISFVFFDEDELGIPLDETTRLEVMKPALEARIPKPPEPRKPKISAPASDATSGDNETKNGERDSNKAGDTENKDSSSAMDVVKEEDDDEEDSEDDDDAVDGTVINFDEPVIVETEKKIQTPVVRKEGRRIVTTLVNSESDAPAAQSAPIDLNTQPSSSMDQDKPSN